MDLKAAYSGKNRRSPFGAEHRDKMAGKARQRWRLAFVACASRTRCFKFTLVYPETWWNHVTIVREVVVRFLLSALGFKRRYFSYVGGYHYAVFPPPDAQLMLSREDCT